MKAVASDGAITTRPRDLELFLELAGWVAPKLATPTYHGFIGWLGTWLESEGVDVLSRLIPLDHPRQLAAESAVIAWLKKPPSVREIQVRRSDTIERSVDWVDTWVRSEGPIPYPYTLRGREAVEPKRVVSALQGLASGWSAVLKLFPENAKRRDRASALDQVSQSGPFRAYTIAEDRLLRSPRLGSEMVANAVRNALGIMGLSLARDPEQERDNLGRACQELYHRLKAKNLNDLLEVSVRLAIARAALSANQEDHVTPGSGWKLDALARPKGKEGKPVMVLRAGDLTCVIAKRKPVHAGKPVEDTLSLAGRGLGLNTQGNQPDVVLTFSLVGTDRQITVLGDAKRNASSDGQLYLSKSLELAAVYAVSYREAMKLRFSDKADVAFEGPVMPAMTLFMLQMPLSEPLDADTLIAGFRGDTSTDRGTPRQASWLAGFALDRHFVPGAPSPVLAAWLGHLGRQALRYLLSTGSPP